MHVCKNLSCALFILFAFFVPHWTKVDRFKKIPCAIHILYLLCYFGVISSIIWTRCIVVERKCHYLKTTLFLMRLVTKWTTHCKPPKKGRGLHIFFRSHSYWYYSPRYIRMCLWLKRINSRITSPTCGTLFTCVTAFPASGASEGVKFWGGQGASFFSL